MNSDDTTKPAVRLGFVFAALLFAFIASFVVTSLRNYGGFNYAGHSTALSDAVVEALGAVFIFPLIHLAIASFWQSKRNGRTRRSIFLGWGIAVGVLQCLLIGQLDNRNSEQTAAKSPKESAAATPAESSKRTTLADWNSALRGSLQTLSSEKTAPGEETSVACVKLIEGASIECINVMVLRRAFDRERRFIPIGRPTIHERGDTPLMFPYILLRDGSTPTLHMAVYFPLSVAREPETGPFPDEVDFGVASSRIAIVINGEVAYETAAYDPFEPPFLPDADQLMALLGSGPNADVAVRLYYTQDLGEDAVERSINLSDEDARKWLAETQVMILLAGSLQDVLGSMKVPHAKP